MDPVGAGLGVLPLAGDAYTYWHNRSEVGNLFRELRKALGQDARIPHTDRDSIRHQVERFRFDPYFLGGIRAYMEDAELDAIPTLRMRAAQLLEVSEGTNAGAVVDVVIGTLERSVNRAFRKDRDAAYHESRRSAEQLKGEIGDAEERIAAQIEATRAEQTSAHEQTAASLARLEGRLTMPSDNAGTDGPLAGPDRILVDLEATSPNDAQQVRDVWAANSPEEIASLAEHPDAALLGASGEAWLAHARLLGYHGLRPAASMAVDQALSRGVDDPVRTLVRASVIAAVDDDGERAEELLADAEARAPDHPAVFLRRAEELRDQPEELLRRLAGFRSDNDQDLAVVETLRARAAMMLDDYGEAERAASRALSHDPSNPATLALRGMARLFPEQARMANEGTPDDAALARAIEDLVAARDELRRQHRFDESGVTVAQIANALVVGDDFSAAVRAIQTPELLDEEAAGRAAPDLARLAVLLDRSDLALGFLPADGPTPQGTLFRAAALVRDGDRSRARAGIDRLAKILDSGDSSHCLYAAISLLRAAGEFADVEWNERADDLLTADDPVVAAVLRADYKRLHDDLEGAEAELLAYSDDPRALRTLVQTALLREDHAAAEQRVRELLRIAPEPNSRLLHAHVALEAGRTDAAVQEFQAIGTDPSLPRRARERAFDRASEISQIRRDFRTLEGIARAWISAFPGTIDGAWLLIFALARLARHAEALEFLDDRRVQVRNLTDAVLAAEIYYRAAPTERGVCEIAALSSRFGREDERLEALVLFTAVERREELPAELAERVRDGFETFPRKFPDSQLLRAMPAPTTTAELIEFVKEHVAPGSELLGPLIEDLRHGRTPLAIVAAACGRHVMQAWIMSDLKPIGFGDTVLDQLERDDAANAIGKGAVWDSAALVIVATLGDELADALRRALPGSQIPQSVLDDADGPAVKGQPDPEGRIQLGYDPQTESPLVTQTAPDIVDMEDQTAERALALAKAIAATYDADPASEDEWAKMFNDDTELRPQMATVAATFAVARRLGLPIYSDDRWVRVSARQLGIPTFGTLALLDSLPGTLLDDAARTRARAILLRSGAWGVNATEQELIDSARDAGWRITPAITAALADAAPWTRDRVATWHLAVDILAAVFAAEPEQLREWTMFILDEAALTMPPVKSFQRLSSLIYTAWEIGSFPPRHPDAFLQALIRVARSLPPRLRPMAPAQIPLDMIEWVMASQASRSEPERFAVFIVLVRRLGPFDIAHACEAFLA